MYNLQTLLLSSCYNLTVLPENIGDFINLRHLDASETNLAEMPVAFGRLKSLRVLSNFVVSKDSGQGSMNWASFHIFEVHLPSQSWSL